MVNLSSPIKISINSKLNITKKMTHYFCTLTTYRLSRRKLYLSSLKFMVAVYTYHHIDYLIRWLQVWSFISQAWLTTTLHLFIVYSSMTVAWLISSFHKSLKEFIWCKRIYNPSIMSTMSWAPKVLLKW